MLQSLFGVSLCKYKACNDFGSTFFRLYYNQTVKKSNKIHVFTQFAHFIRQNSEFLAMEKADVTFGKIILAARKKKGLILRECAALILKEDGTPITFQYLNELENDRRTPSEHIIKQISLVLDIPVEYLYVYAEIFPKGIKKHGSQDKIVNAFRAFVKSISY